MIYRYCKDVENYTYSWERKTHRGYNNMTATKQRELAQELYGRKNAKLAYCPELVDRSGW